MPNGFASSDTNTDRVSPSLNKLVTYMDMYVVCPYYYYLTISHYKVSPSKRAAKSELVTFKIFVFVIILGRRLLASFLMKRRLSRFFKKRRLRFVGSVSFVPSRCELLAGLMLHYTIYF
jgi:hypothetical protein